MCILVTLWVRISITYCIPLYRSFYIIMNNSDLEAEWARDIENMSVVSEASMDEDTLFYELVNVRKRQQ